MSTRRSFMSMLFAIPAAMLLKFKEPHCWPFKPNTNITGEQLAQKDGVNVEFQSRFHDLYLETTTGDYIDGNEVRLFLDWTPEHPELPRYARIKYESARYYTYLDSELIPVAHTVDAAGAICAMHNARRKGLLMESESLRTERLRYEAGMRHDGISKMVGESFKLKFWS